MRSAEAGSRGAPLAALVWAVLGAGACLLVAPFEPNMLEEGILLHVAQRIAHGEQLYRDVLAFTGPLPSATGCLNRWMPMTKSKKRRRQSSPTPMGRRVFAGQRGN